MSARRIVLAAVVAACLLIPLVEAAQKGAGSKPPLTFKEPTHKFSKVMAGKNVTFDFVFTNTSGTVVEIREMRSTCDCYKIGKWNRTIGAGETGKISVVLETETLDGNFRKPIYLTCSKPTLSIISLRMEGIIWQPVDVKPRTANLGIITDKEKPRSVTLSLTNRLNKPLKINKIVIPKDSGLSAEIKEIETGKRLDLLVTVSPPFKFGSNRVQITLETSITEKPKIAIPVKYFLPPPVQVSPQRIVLPFRSLTVPVKRIVTVLNNERTRKLNISDVNINVENIATKTVVIRKGMRYQIILEFPAGFTLPDNGTVALSFKTNNPDVPTVKVSIVPSPPQP